MIKEVLDKKFGPSWHVVVGEGFGFEISYEVSVGLDFNEMIAVLRIRMDLRGLYLTCKDGNA